MPVVRITDATWSRLKNWAVPLEDSPEDAIKKVLEAAEEHLKCTKRAEPYRANGEKQIKKQTNRLTPGVRTPQPAFRQPILEALQELKGSAPSDQVLRLVRDKMRTILNEVDYQKLPSTGMIRWENTAQWERYNLVREGFLKQDSPRGTWELK